MREEVLVAIVMLGISAVGSIITKNDRKWSVVFLLLASVAGSLTASMGIRFREIVEGPFGFLDAILCVVTATLFVFLFYKAGSFDHLFGCISGIKNKAVRSCLTLLFIALPAAFSGFAGASVLTTGAIVGKAMEEKGVEKRKIVEVITVGSFLGMILPPNCIPAIIAANGAGSVLPTPYNGFYLPLLVVAFPSLLVYWLLNIKTLASVEGGKCQKDVNYIILLVVALAAFADGVLGRLCYIGGSTLWFFLGSVAVLATAKGFGGLKGCYEAVSDSLLEAVVPAAFVFAIGSFVEVSSMTGVRGLFSLRILPFSETNVMLVLMAVSVVLGIFLSDPIPAFLMTYAIFPIGWLANTAIVTGVSMALAVVCLLTLRGSLSDSVVEKLGYQGIDRFAVLKGALLPLVLVLIMGVVFTVSGNSFQFLIV